MIQELKPYPGMKDSGVPWLGKLPEHWEVRRLKTMFREVDSRSVTGVETLLSLRMQLGLVDYHASGGKLIPPEALVGYKRTQPGHIVMNRMRAAAGLFAVTPFPGLVSPDYAVLAPLCPIVLDYFVHLFRTPAMTSVFRLESRGLGTGESGFLRLYVDRFGMLAAPVPPSSEQSTIVRFLGHVDHRIRRLLAAKKRLLALLTEQQKNLIHSAVTRGLDTNVRLKSSSVEWLGDIPEHWEVMPLRRRWTVTDCKHLTVPFVDEGVPLASVREAQTFDLVLSKAKRTTEDWYANLVEGGRAPKFGDLIYCRNVGVGAAAFVGTDERFAMGQDVCLIRSVGQNQRYLNYFLRSPSMDLQLARLLVGSTFPRINVSEIKGLVIVVPPRLEQDSIVRYLDACLQTSSQSIECIKREIDLLGEYRTRLISDVVTGKLDVREAAARLPDEPDDSEPLDDADALTEDDDTDPDAAAEEVEG